MSRALIVDDHESYREGGAPAARGRWFDSKAELSGARLAKVATGRTEP